MVRLTLVIAALIGCQKHADAPPSPLQDALIHPVAADAVAITIDGRAPCPAGSAAGWRCGSIDGRAPCPAGSAAGWRCGSIDGRAPCPAGSAAGWRCGSIDGRAPCPAGSAAGWRCGSIDGRAPCPAGSAAGWRCGSIDGTPPAVAPTVVKIVAAQHSACALMSDATLRCWGSNEGGQLGDGTQHDSATPVTPPLHSVKDVVVGTSFACALLDDTSVSCWGTLKNKPGPLVPTAVPGVRNAKQIFARRGSACASAVDGPLVCWGRITERGAGTTSGASRGPTPIPGVDHVVALTDEAAVLEDGDVALWFTDEPVRAGVKHMTEVATYHDVTCALRDDGVVTCFTRANDEVGPQVPCVAKPKPAKPARPAKSPKPRNKPITPSPPMVSAQTLPLPPATHLAFDAGLCVISSRLVCLDVEHNCALLHRPLPPVLHMPP